MVFLSWSRQGTLFLPPQDADAVYFEIIASNLASHGEFSGAINKEVLLLFKGTSILNALKSGPGTYFEEMRSLGIDGRNAYRPPLFPFLLSLPYRFVGQNFLWAKFLNLTFIAFGISMLISAAINIGDLRLGWIVGMLALTDPLNVAFSGLALTEALSFLGLSFIVRKICFGTEISKYPFLWGAQFGLLGLVRPVFVIWLPILLIGLCSSIKERLKFLFALSLVLAPWGIRNSLHLKTFAPLGSQSGVVLGTVYGDKALERSGNWNRTAHQEFIAEASELPIESRESFIMQKGQRKAWDWIRANPILLPALFLSRVTSLWWKDAMPHQRILVLLSFFGVTFSLRKRWTGALLLFCLAHTVTIGLTGNVEREPSEFFLYGRYLYSLHPVFLLFGASGILEGTKLLVNWTASRKEISISEYPQIGSSSI